MTAALQMQRSGYLKKGSNLCNSWYTKNIWQRVKFYKYITC